MAKKKSTIIRGREYGVRRPKVVANIRAMDPRGVEAHPGRVHGRFRSLPVLISGGGGQKRCGTHESGVVVRVTGTTGLTRHECPEEGKEQ